MDKLSRYINGKLKEAQIIQIPAGGKIQALDFIKPLGSGVYASVYLARDQLGREFAVRIAQRTAEAPTNIYSQVFFSKYTMAPPVFAYIMTEAQIIIIMDLIQGSLEDILETAPPEEFEGAFRCLLDKKYLLKVLHGDCWIGNIVVLRDGKTLGFIDFDFTLFDVPAKINILDFIPIIGSLKAFYKQRARRLIDGLISYYKEKFDMSIDFSLIKGRPQKGGYGYYYNALDPLHSYVLSESSSLGAISAAFPKFKRPRITR
jgi:hypothetical protein